ncbi:hypothetical protein C8R45DRAFT_1071129 [Mycena sanguinolenta]|nr:hypothetical protein C8R45DRAFT_1071129 [Mycena sanguinolenta]
MKCLVSLSSARACVSSPLPLIRLPSFSVRLLHVSLPSVAVATSTWTPATQRPRPPVPVYSYVLLGSSLPVQTSSLDDGRTPAIHSILRPRFGTPSCVNNGVFQRPAQPAGEKGNQEDEKARVNSHASPRNSLIPPPNIGIYIQLHSTL